MFSGMAAVIAVSVGDISESAENAVRALAREESSLAAPISVGDGESGEPGRESGGSRGIFRRKQPQCDWKTLAREASDISANFY
jgi:hypothetical protein